MGKFKVTFTLDISIEVQKFDFYEKTIEFKNSDPSLDYETKKSLVNQRLFNDHNEKIVKTIRDFYKGSNNSPNFECTFKSKNVNYVCSGEDKNICSDSYLEYSRSMYEQSQNLQISCVYERTDNYMDMVLPSSHNIFTYLGDDILS